jgi:aryl-alcohol dehydrogenase-like predicted oxidoreductase
MGFTSFYSKSSEVTEEFCIDLIGQALEQGCNFFDTAYIYGNGANEKLLAKVINFRKKNFKSKIIILIIRQLKNTAVKNS